MPLVNYAQYVELTEAARRRFRFTKASVTVVAGRLESAWTAAPFAGVVPTVPVALGRATVGNLNQIPQPFAITDPLFMAEMEIDSAAALALTTGMLIDRLSHQAGLDGTIAVEQVTNLPTAALTRYATGEGVMIALQIYTALGATSVTVTARYTNQAAVGLRTTQPVVIPVSPAAESIFTLPLQNGDTGVQSVEGVTLSATTGAVGNFGVVLYMPIGFLPTSRGLSHEMKPYKNTLISGGAGLEEVSSDACWDVFFMSSTTATGIVMGTVNLIEVP
jgi:hypothetical protein